MPRALILKFGAIGDVIMAIPAAHQLHLAGHRVDWVCGPAVLPILKLYPWVDAIEADEQAILKGSPMERIRAIRELWRKLRKAAGGGTYDLVVTLYYDPRYRILALPIRARRKIQLSNSDRTKRLLPGRHHTDEFARILLNRPDRATPSPLAPVLAGNLPPSPLAPARRERVVLAPAGARNMMADDALRRWPHERYVELANSLIARDIEVVLIGGPTDAWVQPFFANVAVTDLIGQLALPETLALLDSASVLVTHDTGPLHLAGITRVGIVSIFGPTDPRGRLPQRPGTLALWGGEGFACRPCYDSHNFAPCPSNDCIAQVTVEMVREEILAMLADRSRGVLAAPRIVVPPSTIPALTQIELQPS